MIKGCLTNVDEAESDAELSNYPNPFSEITTIKYNVKSINSFSKAEIRITDVLGKEIKTILIKDKGLAVSVDNSFRLDKSNLKSGIYFYSLLVDGKMLKTMKMIVM